MPVFEFRCVSCGKRFRELVGVVAGESEIKCPNCSSAEVTKLVSRFVRGRTEDDRVDELADHIDLYGEPESGREARELMREMGRAMDEDLSDEMEEMFEADMEGTLDED
jgi:putative FmdB family regulatory protein